METPVRVLILTNLYPNRERPWFGIFVKRQVTALTSRPGVTTRVCMVDGSSRKSEYLFGRRRVAMAIREFAPDVVHVHYGLSLLALPRTRARTVVTLHGSDLSVPWQRVITRLALTLRPPSAVVIVSEEMRRQLPMKLRDRAVVIPCGVEVHVPEGPQTRDEGSAAERDAVIGFPSSPDNPAKDYALFTSAINELSGRLRVDARVLSGVPPEDVPAWMLDLDCLLMTSVREGSPVVTKEALCHGVRVVSTRVGDVEDQVSGFTGCRVVAVRDAAAIAAAVEEALLEPRPDATAAASRFGIDRECDRLLDIYSSLPVPVAGVASGGRRGSGD